MTSDPNRVRAFMRAAARDVAPDLAKLPTPERCRDCGELFALHHAKAYGVNGETWHRDAENCGWAIDDAAHDLRVAGDKLWGIDP